MRLARTSRELVHKYEGATEFSKRTGIPVSTAKKYSNGTSSMPKHLIPMVDLALMAGYKPTWRSVAIKNKPDR